MDALEVYTRRLAVPLRSSYVMPNYTLFTLFQALCEC